MWGNGCEVGKMQRPSLAQCRGGRCCFAKHKFEQRMTTAVNDLEQLARTLIESKRWHELFEARLLAARHRLGLPAIDPPPLDEVPEPTRTKLERAYTDACREVGEYLASSGHFREAWHYLRAAGQRATLQSHLATVTPNRGGGDDPDDRGNLEELIEVALYDGVDPPRGYGWVIEHFGTCNAISTLEGIASQLPPTELIRCVSVLVGHLLDEVRTGVVNHIRQQKTDGPEPTGSLRDLLAAHHWLTEGGGVHVDASHLAAAVRFARVLTDPEDVDRALQLAEYGTGLHPDLQYPGDPPFTETYPAHRLFFAATLGREVEEAITYFRERALQSDTAHDGTGPVETLLVLLDRAGRPGEALGAYAELVPAGTLLSPYAPRLVDLAMRSGEWEQYEQLLRERDDPVGLAVAKLARNG